MAVFKYFVFLSVFNLFLFFPSNAQDINILIISGQNNHDWPETTKILVQMYEENRLFKVQVTHRPDTLNQNCLKSYDVIVSNWNAWPDVTGRQWGSTMEKAFLEFIKSGKGFVPFHAASAAFHDWPEYQELVGGTWKLGQTGHGPVHEFKVSLEDYDHPVTRDLTDFWIRDELWHRVATKSAIKTLCSAFSAELYKGSNAFEPAVITTEYGEGRCFYNILGHDTTALQNVGWQTLMLRGTEWAATGKVTIPVPEDWPSQAAESNSEKIYSLYNDEKSIGMLNNGRFIWQLHHSEVSKAWIHLNLQDGTSLTWKSPPDHPWHHALWFSWKYINGLNYWEEQEGLSEGRSTVSSIDFFQQNDGSVKVELTVDYHPPDKLAILKENRSLMFSVPDQFGNYFLDWTSQFTAQSDTVILERTPIEGQPGGRNWGGYATLALRINTKTLKNIKLSDNNGRTGLAIHKNPASWIDISGNIHSNSTKRAGITVFDHPENPRHPPPGYVIDNHLDDHNLQFVYSNPGLLYREGMTLQPKDTITLKYRILVHEDINDEELHQKYKEYCK